MQRSNKMNLQVAVVLSCTDTGCRVQPIDGEAPIETLYSKPILKYNIPIRPDQFVIVDKDTVPPETIYRWNRGTITHLDEHGMELEIRGKRLAARRSNTLDAEIQVGNEVVVDGFSDENRQVIDLVVDGLPSQVNRLCTEWFSTMSDANVRATE
jgi:hypothetical protein